MIGTVLQILQTALSLWDNHEKMKYIDQVVNLKRDYYAEISKPADQISDAVITNICVELRIISSAFCSAASDKNTANKP